MLEAVGGNVDLQYGRLVDRDGDGKVPYLPIALGLSGVLARGHAHFQVGRSAHRLVVRSSRGVLDGRGRHRGSRHGVHLDASCVQHFLLHGRDGPPAAAGGLQGAFDGGILHGAAAGVDGQLHRDVASVSRRRGRCRDGARGAASACAFAAAAADERERAHAECASAHDAGSRAFEERAS